MQSGTPSSACTLVALAGKVLSGVAVATMISPMSDGSSPAAASASFAAAEESARSEEHTSELQSLMRISYAVFCLKKTKTDTNQGTDCRTQSRYTNRRRQLIKCS